MGQIISWPLRKRAFSETEKSTESSVQSWEASFRVSDSSVSSCGSSVDSRIVLNLRNNLFVCNLVKDDPYGYSSRVYYRSNVNVGEGVPFQWEAEPGKPKTDHEHHGFSALPLSPPPSFGSSHGEKKLIKKHKKIRRKSKKAYVPCWSCIPFRF
ncbi:hypothetical protein SUGI_0246240 [Cryptomeria japonica]|nr:hypothetical protein SUGI_0246240 [Cryptomeria japonica]